MAARGGIYGNMYGDGRQFPDPDARPPRSWFCESCKIEVRVKPLFAWYDLWVGVFWDRAKRKLYILPLPCIGVVIQF